MIDIEKGTVETITTDNTKANLTITEWLNNEGFDIVFDNSPSRSERDILYLSITLENFEELIYLSKKIKSNKIVRIYSKDKKELALAYKAKDKVYFNFFDYIFYGDNGTLEKNFWLSNDEVKLLLKTIKELSGIDIKEIQKFFKEYRKVETE